MAYLPRGIDNSTGGFEFPVSERFRLDGGIVGLSYGYGSWYQILRNDGYADYNRAQGTIVPLAGFRSGVVRGAIHPGDGQGTCGGHGWLGQLRTRRRFLERVRYTGKPFPMLENVHAYENGIELQFSEPVSLTPPLWPRTISFSNGTTSIRRLWLARVFREAAFAGRPRPGQCGAGRGCPGREVGLP